jgi:hypothetical protein
MQVEMIDILDAHAVDVIVMEALHRSSPMITEHLPAGMNCVPSMHQQ